MLQIKDEFPNKSENMSLDINTILKLVPCFDTNQNEQVYRFIRSCDSAFKLSSETQKSVLLIYALNNITGVGASDVHSKTYTSWDDLKSYLIEKFSNVKTVSHLNLELQSMFQRINETITEYFHRVDLCRSKIIEKLNTEVADDSLKGRIITTEETALNVFVNGISSDIGNMLRTKGFSNLTEAGRFAMQEDKIRCMNAARQSLFKTSISKPLPNKFPNIQRQYNNTNFQRSIPRPNNAMSSPPAKTCNYCKFPGHVISECRKRQFNNNLRQNQLALPGPSRPMNHLNLQESNEQSVSMDTAQIAQTLDNLQL